jgi:hypothetical protein
MLFEERQHMFCTIRGPCRLEPVFAKIQRPTTMNCNKLPVLHFSLPIVVAQFKKQRTIQAGTAPTDVQFS